jgi:hypothetical protein
MVLFLIVSFFFFSVSFVSVDTISVQKEIDWEKGVLYLNITKPIETEDERQPDGRYITEMRIREMMPDIFLSYALELHVDSYNTLGDMLDKERQSIKSLNKIIGQGKKEYACLSEDLNNIKIKYSYPFFGENGIATAFIWHSLANPVNRKLGFIPSRKYTGLIIYAKGEYMSHGKDISVRLEPALFPTLYDKEMNVILDKHMCVPDYLKQWGMVLYTDSTDEIPFTRRIGLDPLRTIAEGIFGKHNGDIILPEDAVNKLICRQENRQMLQEGRILIILDKEQIQVLKTIIQVEE